MLIQKIVNGYKTGFTVFIKEPYKLNKKLPISGIYGLYPGEKSSTFIVDKRGNVIEWVIVEC